MSTIPASLETSLAALTDAQKLELMERLARELRARATVDAAIPPGSRVSSEERKLLEQLIASGMMTQLPEIAADYDDPDDQPVTIEGEPLSETIIRERR